MLCPEDSTHSLSPYPDALSFHFFIHHVPRPQRERYNALLGLSSQLSLTYSQHLEQAYVSAFTTVLCRSASPIEAGSSILINNLISSTVHFPTHLSLTYSKDLPSGPFPVALLLPQAILEDPKLENKNYIESIAFPGLERWLGG